MVFGKIKDIIKKRQEESKQREATDTGFKTVPEYEKWKQETKIAAREKIAYTTQKKRKQKLKEKIEKIESNRNKSVVESYADVFDKVSKGVDKFQKGVSTFEKGVGKLENGINSSGKPKKFKSKSKRKSSTTKIVYINPPKRRTKPKRKKNDDGFSWLEK